MGRVGFEGIIEVLLGVKHLALRTAMATTVLGI